MEIYFFWDKNCKYWSVSWSLMYSVNKCLPEWETPVWQQLRNIHSGQQWGFHMFQGFHTFKPHQLSAACQYVSHLLLDNTLSRGVAGQACTVLWVWGVKPPPPLSQGTRAASLCLLRPPELPGQQLQGTAAGWLASALKTASSWGVTETIPLSGGSPFTQITKHLSALLLLVGGRGQALCSSSSSSSSSSTHMC